jgi:hypothetical protein
MDLEDETFEKLYSQAESGFKKYSMKRKETLSKS